jgi:hypothetical protein
MHFISCALRHGLQLVLLFFRIASAARCLAVGAARVVIATVAIVAAAIAEATIAEAAIAALQDAETAIAVETEIEAAAAAAEEAVVTDARAAPGLAAVTAARAGVVPLQTSPCPAASLGREARPRGGDLARDLGRNRLTFVLLFESGRIKFGDCDHLAVCRRVR